LKTFGTADIAMQLNNLLAAGLLVHAIHVLGD
jgi:hypothetical protein